MRKKQNKNNNFFHQLDKIESGVVQKRGETLEAVNMDD